VTRQLWENRTTEGKTTSKKSPSTPQLQLYGGRGKRCWFKGIFHLYPPDKQQAVVVQGAARSNSNKKRQILKSKKSRLQKGLTVLQGESWVLDDAEFELRKNIPGQTPAHLVNAIQTDGLQVQVTLCSRGDDTQAPGVKYLHKAGYSHITETFDIGKHHRGVFKDAAALPKELVAILDQRDPHCFVEAVGNDPGNKFLTTVSRTRLTTSITYVCGRNPAPGWN
jgi:hypothetical protein